MTALPIYLDTTQRVKRAPSIVVSWKKNWQDEWQTMHAEVELLDRACNPQIDRCLLRQRYGYIADESDGQYRVVYPFQPSIMNAYVRVQVTPDLLTVVIDTSRLLLDHLPIGAVVYESYTDTVYRFLGPLGGEGTPANWTTHDIPRVETWYGVITNLRREAMGGDVLGESGDLVIEVLGMEVLMTRKQIASSTIELAAGVSVFSIERGLPFNAHRGDRGRGTYATANKSPTPSPLELPIFAKTLTSAENWSAADIVKYLLYYQRPTDASGPYFELDSTTAEAILNSFVPIGVETDGRTLYDVLNAVIDRKRGLLWWVEPYWADELLIFVLRVETSEVTSITLPSGVTLPANQQLRSMAIDSIGHMVTYNENYDGLRKYAQVTVEGGRQGSVFTLSIADGTLVEDWTVTEEGRYKTAASTMPTYNVLDRSHQRTVNDNVRTSDALRHVFSRFRIPNDWDGRAGNGSGGSKYHVFPVIPMTGTAKFSQTGHEFWNDGLRFQNVIPLRAQWDYTDVGYTPYNRNKTGTAGEFRRPFAVISVPNVSGGDEWFMADSAGVNTVADETRSRNDNRVSCSLRMHEEQPGLTLTPSGPSHVLASGMSFDGSEPTIAHSHVPRPVTNYETAKFTVYALADNRVSVTWPPTASTVSNQASVHVIRIGDRARVDYVVPGTIIDVKAGDLDRSDQPMYCRDDRAAMVDLARQAWLWYGTTRIAIELSIANITNQMRLGDLIGQVTYGYRFMTTTNGTVIMFGSKPWARSGSTDRVVNSAITRISWQFLRGVTTFITDYAAIDFEAEAIA